MGVISHQFDRCVCPFQVFVDVGSPQGRWYFESPRRGIGVFQDGLIRCVIQARRYPVCLYGGRVCRRIGELCVEWSVFIACFTGLHGGFVPWIFLWARRWRFVWFCCITSHRGRWFGGVVVCHFLVSVWGGVVGVCEFADLCPESL